MKQYFVRFSFQLKNLPAEETSMIFNDKYLTGHFSSTALNYQVIEFIKDLKKCEDSDVISIDFKIINRL